MGSFLVLLLGLECVFFQSCDRVVLYHNRFATDNSTIVFVVISNVLFLGFVLFCFALNKILMVLCSILFTRAKTS